MSIAGVKAIKKDEGDVLLLQGRSLDLEDGARQLAGLGLHGGGDAHGRQGAPYHAAGEPEELRMN